MRHLLIFILLTTSMWGQFTPGKLSRVHADLEGLANCTKCHSAGQQIKASNCLDCHKLLKARIDANLGLHARKEFRDCVQCHIEHHGLDFELVYWKEGEKNFNHDKTGYPLEGGHKKPECRDCHQEKNIVEKAPLIEAKKELNRTFLGLRQECLSCHHDEHRGQMEEDCLSCHNMDAWKPAPGFDHDKTKFKLTGKHQKVDCEKCHKSMTDNRFPGDADFLQFKGTKFATCQSCHEDTHKGRFGNDCQSCHNTSGWQDVNDRNFNHDKTRFPLRGKHGDVKCESCHKPGKRKRGIPFNNCLDCHNDFHERQFADRPSKGECAECHTVDGFTPSTFTNKAHDEVFKLEGAHLAQPCFVCHSSEAKKTTAVSSRSTLKLNRFTIQSKTCQDCHGDPHKGDVDKFLAAEAAGCQFCHSVSSWRDVTFDHSSTRFSLVGKHETIECKACHKPIESDSPSARINLTKLDRLCVSCHTDIHEKQFDMTYEVSGKKVSVTDCRTCHTPHDWQARNFDHDEDSQFKLEGAHERVECTACHKSESIADRSFIRYKPLATECRSCHGGEKTREAFN